MVLKHLKINKVFNGVARTFPTCKHNDNPVCHVAISQPMVFN